MKQSESVKEGLYPAKLKYIFKHHSLSKSVADIQFCRKLKLPDRQKRQWTEPLFKPKRHRMLAHHAELEKHKDSSNSMSKSGRTHKGCCRGPPGFCKENDK